METDTLVNVITIILAIGNFVCLYSISRKKSYNEEKGKNLATKEDIADITQRIESVKGSYNKALEAHKIELQKEFESYKYINELCNSIDKELLRKLVSCKKEMENDFRIHRDNDNYGTCESSIKSLYNYLKTYDVRYKHNKIVKLIFEHYEKIESLHKYYEEDCGPFDMPEYMQELGKIHSYVDQLLASFLPKLQLKPEA